MTTASSTGKAGGTVAPQRAMLLASGGEPSIRQQHYIIELDHTVLHLVRQLRGRLAASLARAHKPVGR